GSEAPKAAWSNRGRAAAAMGGVEAERTAPAAEPVRRDADKARREAEQRPSPAVAMRARREAAELAGASADRSPGLDSLRADPSPKGDRRAKRESGNPSADGAKTREQTRVESGRAREPSLENGKLREPKSRPESGRSRETPRPREPGSGARRAARRVPPA